MVVFNLYTPRVNWLSVYFLLFLHRSCCFFFFLSFFKQETYVGGGGDVGAGESLRQRQTDCCGWMFEMPKRHLGAQDLNNQHFNLQLKAAQ